MLLALDLKHLLLLRELAETGTMVEAAERLHVSPSALTHRLREAERRLGVLLAVKRGRRLMLTRSGARLAHAAKQIVHDARQSELDAVRIGTGVTNVVRVTSGFYSEYSWFPELMRRLKKADPGLLLEIVPDAWNHPMAALESGAIDLAIMPAAEKPEGFEAAELFEDELVLVAANSHRLAKREHVEARDLKDQTYIAYWFSSRTVRGFENDRFFGPAGIRPANYMSVESLDAVKELVSADLGVTILAKSVLRSDFAMKRFSSARLTKDGLPLTWFAVARPDQWKNAGVAAVVRELVKIPSRSFGRGQASRAAR